MKRRIPIALVVLALCGAAVCWWLQRPPAPVFYEGKSLETWRALAIAGDTNGIAALRALGPKAVPGLVYTLRTRDSTLRRLLWFTSAKLPAKERKFIQAQLPRLTLPTLREDSAHALGIIGPPAARAVPVLVRSLRDSEGTVRWQAASALSAIGEAAVPALTGALEDDSAPVRHCAAYALGQAGPRARSAIPALLHCLTDSNEQVRDSAGYALTVIGPAARIALMGQRDFGEAPERAAATRLLERFQTSPREAVPDLLLMCAAKDSATRALGLELLATIRPFDKTWLPVLTHGLADRSTEVQMAAAHALGKIGKRAGPAIPALQRVSETGGKSLRLAAADALARIQKEPPVRNHDLSQEGKVGNRG